jgi:RNA recognition motif-containing protein
MQKEKKQISYSSHFMKYFVGGILYSAREHDIERYMKQFGKLVDVAIMRDK